MYDPCFCNLYLKEITRGKEFPLAIMNMSDHPWLKVRTVKRHF